MVYMYYGFFLFLLYMTAPLWLFLPVAAGSWWALRSSFNLQKNMRISVTKTRLKGELAVETQEGLKSDNLGAWGERRKFNRVAASLEVTYEALEDGWQKDAAFPSSDHPAADGFLPLARRFKSGKAVIRDISEGGLCIMGEDPLSVGQQLKLFLQLPSSGAPITLLAEVRSTRASFKLGKSTYKAGLEIADVDLEDMVHLLDYLFNERTYKQGSPTAIPF